MWISDGKIVDSGIDSPSLALFSKYGFREVVQTEEHILVRKNLDGRL